jgi:hypothetical protein
MGTGSWAVAMRAVMGGREAAALMAAERAVDGEEVGRWAVVQLAASVAVWVVVVGVAGLLVAMGVWSAASMAVVRAAAVRRAAARAAAATEH